MPFCARLLERIANPGEAAAFDPMFAPVRLDEFRVTIFLDGRSYAFVPFQHSLR